MKINYCLFLVLALAFACNETPKQPETSNPAATSAAKGGLVFAFSNHKWEQSDSRTESDWCHVPLPEAAVVSADPVNTNRRMFTLGDTPHRVTVDFGHLTASFMLKRNGNLVEIYTSDNYPECLSNRVNFTLGADGLTFRYDNKMHINFEIQLIPLANGTQIALEMGPDSGYGIVVRR